MHEASVHMSGKDAEVAVGVIADPGKQQSAHIQNLTASSNLKRRTDQQVVDIHKDAQHTSSDHSDSRHPQRTHEVLDEVSCVNSRP